MIGNLTPNVKCSSQNFAYPNFQESECSSKFLVRTCFNVLHLSMDIEELRAIISSSFCEVYFCQLFQWSIWCCTSLCREGYWPCICGQIHQHTLPDGQTHREEWNQCDEPATPSKTAQSERRLRRQTRNGAHSRIVSYLHYLASI